MIPPHFLPNLPPQGAVWTWKAWGKPVGCPVGIEQNSDGSWGQMGAVFNPLQTPWDKRGQLGGLRQVFHRNVPIFHRQVSPIRPYFTVTYWSKVYASPPKRRPLMISSNFNLRGSWGKTTAHTTQAKRFHEQGFPETRTTPNS